MLLVEDVDPAGRHLEVEAVHGVHQVEGDGGDGSLVQQQPGRGAQLQEQEAAGEVEQEEGGGHQGQPHPRQQEVTLLKPDRGSINSNRNSGDFCFASVLQHSEEEDDCSSEAEAVSGEVKVECEAPVLGLDLGGEVEPHAAVHQLQQHDGEHGHPQRHAQAAGAGAGLGHRASGDN